MTPKSLSIALTELLKLITSANGFASNAGDKVYRGRQHLDESAVPCIVIGEADDVPTGEIQYGKTVSVKQRFVLDAWVASDPDNPNDAAHDAIADIKRVLFANVNATGGGGQLQNVCQRIRYVNRSIGQRPEGGNIVRGTVVIEVSFKEDLSP